MFNCPNTSETSKGLADKRTFAVLVNKGSELIEKYIFLYKLTLHN